MVVADNLRVKSPFLDVVIGRARRLTVAVALALVATGLAGCREEQAVVEKPVPVRVATVAYQPITSPRRYVGTLRARYETDLGFRVGGKIIDRLVDVGDHVTAGTVIARLDPTDFQLALEQNQAELSAARSSRDQAVAAEQRYRILRAEGHVSDAALDQRVATADDARARVERAERAIALQTNQLDYTTLKATRDGVVTQLLAEKGQVVAAGQAVARTADPSEIEAIIALPETEVSSLDGARTTVSLWVAPDKTYEAHVREVAPDADRASRTYQVRLTIDGRDPALLLGRTVNVTVNRAANTQAVALPLSAVTNDTRGPSVFVVHDGRRLERRAVTVHAFTEQAALIDGGLGDGEQVVTLGVHTLDEAVPVRIVETKKIASTSNAAAGE